MSYVLDLARSPMISYFRTSLDESTRIRLSSAFDLHKIESIEIRCREEHDVAPKLYRTLIHEQQAVSKICSVQVLSTEEHDNTASKQLSNLRRPRPITQPPKCLVFSKRPSLTEFYKTKLRTTTIQELCKIWGYIDPRLLSRLRACVAAFLTAGIREHPRAMKLDALMYLLAGAEMESGCFGNLFRNKGQTLELGFKFKAWPGQYRETERGRTTDENSTERFELGLQTPAYYQPDYEKDHATHPRYHEELDEDLFEEVRCQVDRQLGLGKIMELICTVTADDRISKEVDVAVPAARLFHVGGIRRPMGRSRSMSL